MAVFWHCYQSLLVLYFFIQLGNFVEQIIYAISDAQSDKQDRQPLYSHGVMF